MRIFGLLITLFCSPFLQAKSIHDISNRFSSEVKKELQNNNIPGAAFAIIKDGKIVSIKAFGHTDKSKKRKVNQHTVFRLASVSKPFAATAATMLALENKLDLSDPIKKYVPNFELAKPGAADKIQIKHILSHSTGLMPNAYDNLLHENWSMDKIVSRFNKVTPICQPEKCYGYQNIAYGFLEPAIEASQAMSYADFLEERIFNPLDMKTASVGHGKFKRYKNAAKPHILRKRIKTGKRDKNGKPIRKNVWRTVNVAPDYYKVAPAAGVNASITDMSKWLIANMGHKPKVLPPRLLEELTTPRIKTKKDLRRRHWRQHLKDAHYGYGWRLYQFNDMPIVYHSGWVEGYRADIGYSPKTGIGFAILINAESNVINKISSRFWEKIYQNQLSLVKS